MSTALSSTLSGVFEPCGMGLSEAAETMISAFISMPNKKKWLDEAGTVLQFANALEERNSLVRGLILKVVHTNWNGIRLEDRSPYYSFYEWAEKITQRDSKTIDNWMRTADVFILNPKKIEFPKTVSYDVVTPSLNGRVTKETVTVPFDPEKIQHSKLVVACHKVVEGEMNEARYSALCNPNVSFSEFLSVLHNTDKILNVKEKPDSVVLMEGPIMYRHWPGGEDVEILEFNITEFDDEDSRVRKDIRNIKEFMGVK